MVTISPSKIITCGRGARRTCPAAAGRSTWSLPDVQEAHEASNDPDRSEAWADIVNGRYFHAAEETWDELSTAIDNYLIR
jgi:hypothetical protein